VTYFTYYHTCYNYASYITQCAKIMVGLITHLATFFFTNVFISECSLHPCCMLPCCVSVWTVACKLALGQQLILVSRHPACWWLVIIPTDGWLSLLSARSPVIFPAVEHQYQISLFDDRGRLCIGVVLGILRWWDLNPRPNDNESTVMLIGCRVKVVSVSNLAALVISVWSCRFGAVWHPSNDGDS